MIGPSHLRNRARGLCGSAIVLGVLAGCSIAAPPAAITPAPQAPAQVVTRAAANTPFPDAATPPASPAILATATASAADVAASLTPATPTIAPSPPPVALGPSQPVEYGTSGRREIALTFDAGADRGYAAEILDLLRAEGITASFGIQGQWAEANPDLVQRMVDEGHMLFNHGWSHASFTGVTTGAAALSRDERWAEVERTEQAVRDITGVDMRPYFRPPYGDIDASSLADLGAIGYSRTLLWSCDSRDSLGATADEIMTNCIDAAQPGRIVLLHVGAQSAAYEVLPRAVASLRADGFSFVTADQILLP